MGGMQRGWREQRWQTLCIKSVDSEVVCEEEEEEEGESEFVDADTDGIVYLLWPRLDFQCLTCCNPRSVHRAPRVAQTSHRCFLYERSATAAVPLSPHPT